MSHKFQFYKVQYFVQCAFAFLLFSTFFFTQTAAGAATLEEQVNVRGEWRQGGLIIGFAPAGSQILLNQQSIKQAPTGQFVLGLDRDAAPKQTLTIRHQHQEYIKSFEVLQYDWPVQRIEGISKKIMNPDPDDVARARQEAQLVKKARQEYHSRLDFLMGFQWPLIGRISGVFGSQRVYNGVPGRPHYGVDIAAPKGTPVKAPAPGVVTLVHNNMFYSGGTLILDHGMGVSSTFIHLSEIHVTPGQEIRAGEVIAAVGSTGRSTGPHLDWRVNWFKKRLDPSLLVGPMPQQ